MRITYDPKADAAYIYVKDHIEPGAVAETSRECEALRGSLYLDFDDSGHLIGIEVLSARHVLLPETLAKAELLQ